MLELSCVHCNRLCRRAIDLARREAPHMVTQLEEQWGDWLMSQKALEAAINHFIEAGASLKAVEAAIGCRQFSKAAVIMEALVGSAAVCCVLCAGGTNGWCCSVLYEVGARGTSLVWLRGIHYFLSVFVPQIRILDLTCTHRHTCAHMHMYTCARPVGCPSRVMWRGDSSWCP